MNIFYLSHDVKQCAEWHVDKHVVKMIMEYAQLLSTAHHVLDGSNAIAGLLKKTHENHPCAKWARESSGNYEWLYSMFCAVLDEKVYRYTKPHMYENLREPLSNLPKNIHIGNFTNPPAAVGEAIKYEDIIETYKSYYRIEKTHLHAWKKRERPEWL